VPTFLSNERVEGCLQQRFENMCRHRKEAVNFHRAHGHLNNLNLEAHGIPHKILKRYILAVSCDACRAAIGKRDNKTSAVTVTKRQNIAEQTKLSKPSTNSLLNGNLMRFLSLHLVQTTLTSSKSVQLRTL